MVMLKSYMRMQSHIISLVSAIILYLVSQIDLAYDILFLAILGRLVQISG